MNVLTDQRDPDIFNNKALVRSRALTPIRKRKRRRTTRERIVKRYSNRTATTLPGTEDGGKEKERTICALWRIRDESMRRRMLSEWENAE